MINRYFQQIKPIILALILFGLLQVTGLWGNVSATTQLLVMNTGILDVHLDEETTSIDFDYDFTIKDLGGNMVSFDQYKGKLLFINMWATWCGPCKAEMPGIQSLSDKLKDEEVTFVMLSVDKDASLPKVKSYLENSQFTFPVFMLHGYLPELLQVPSIPTTFIVSKEGKILLKEIGTRNYDTNKMVNFLKEHASK